MLCALAFVPVDAVCEMFDMLQNHLPPELKILLGTLKRLMSAASERKGIDERLKCATVHPYGTNTMRFAEIYCVQITPVKDGTTASKC